MSRTLEIVSPGALTLVQDLGRPGLAHLGVGTAGAMDRAAHTLANRLVGNPVGAATLEVVLGGLVVRFAAPTWFAVTGAWGELVLDGATSGGRTGSIDDDPDRAFSPARTVEPHTATLAPAGSTLSVGAATAGVRFYLAVRGGITVPAVLGSRSRDTLAALGPAPLRAGDVLPIGAEPATAVPSVDLVPVGPPATEVTLALRPGPREDWFAAASITTFYGSAWTTSARSDRTGIRLEGVALERDAAHAGELPSEGMVAGAIQVSPDGTPTILAVDHPVTGGYPVIAVVTAASLDALAQLRPGQEVRFLHATGHG